jgi:hypothetical protein
MMIKPLFVNVPLTSSWILVVFSAICFSVPLVSFASTSTEPMSVLSRSLVPDAPALCQFTPEADSFPVAFPSVTGKWLS